MATLQPKFTEPVYAITSPSPEELSGEKRKGTLDRFFAVQKYFAAPINPPDFVRVTDRQGGVFVQFLPTEGAEGYEVVVAADSSADNVIRRERWVGGRNTEGFVALGNLDQDVFVRVRSYAGERFSGSHAKAPCGRQLIEATSTPADPATPEAPPEPINPDLGGSHDRPEDGHGDLLP